MVQLARHPSIHCGIRTGSHTLNITCHALYNRNKRLKNKMDKMSRFGHLNLKLNVNVSLTKPSSPSNFFTSNDNSKANCQPGRYCLGVQTNSSDQHSFSFKKSISFQAFRPLQEERNADHQLLWLIYSPDYFPKGFTAIRKEKKIPNFKLKALQKALT